VGAFEDVDVGGLEDASIGRRQAAADAGHGGIEAMGFAPGALHEPHDRGGRGDEQQQGQDEEDQPERNRGEHADEADGQKQIADGFYNQSNHEVSLSSVLEAKSKGFGGGVQWSG